MSEPEKSQGRGSAKPQVTVRGRNGSYLSMWISEGKIKVSVSRRNANGSFERVDDYTIDTDFLLYKVIEYARNALSRKCEFLNELAEDTEVDSDK